jgi:Tfp pilus assembly protein PilP
MKNSRKSFGRILAATILAGFALVLVFATPEEENAEPPEEQRETIHKILEQSEEVLTGRGFTYDPAGRRDPFRSLLRGLSEEQLGPRPKGIKGMLINEVDLVGIVDKKGRAVAFFNGTDNRGYFLSVGDSLYDGKITKIDPREGLVIFRQKVDDPRSIKPYREVTKRLKPVKEEGL